MRMLQDWTKQESKDAEGVVTFTYRTQPDEPPDVKTIQKQMASVAWQPGANRIVITPAEVRATLQDLCRALCTSMRPWSLRLPGVLTPCTRTRHAAWHTHSADADTKRRVTPFCFTPPTKHTLAQEELRDLQPGEVRQLEPARPPPPAKQTRRYGQQAMGLPSDQAVRALPACLRCRSC